MQLMRRDWIKRLVPLLIAGVCALGWMIPLSFGQASASVDNGSSRHVEPRGHDPKPADARANRFVQGNASPALPSGPPGKVAVIASAALSQLLQPGGPSSFTIPIVVRNNTNKTQSDVQVTAVAKVNGTLVETGSSQLPLNPLMIKPAQIAIGYVYFQNLIPTTSTVTYTVTTGGSSEFDANVLVTQSNTAPVAGGYLNLIGTVKNTTKKPLDAGATVYGICFDAAGQPTGDANTGTSGQRIAPGASSPFSVQVSGDNTPCVSWLVTAAASTLSGLPSS
jgi:hypothetical protein